MMCVITISHDLQVNGRLVLEGVLRICWGVEHSIRIKEFDDKRLISKRPSQGMGYQLDLVRQIS